MRLFASLTSPYARKVRVAMIELGLADGVTLVETNPLGRASELREHNPLGKVPTLVLADGTALYDSRTICDHLVRLNPERGLLPADGSARDRVLTDLALADGVCDAAFSIVTERRRPDPQQSPEWLERWRSAIDHAVTAMRPRGETAQPQDLGEIAAAVALAYLDFRLPDLGWRTRNPDLAAWQTNAALWPSMRSTEPPTG